MIKSQMEEKESEEKVSNSLLELQPNLFGIGLNLNKFFQDIRSNVRTKVLDDPKQEKKNEE